MLVPKVNVSEFEKFGFKKCKGSYGRNGVYYLCVARGVEMMIVTPCRFDIFPWQRDDPRIHTRPNCKYSDHRTATDILYELIKADMLKEEFG